MSTCLSRNKKSIVLFKIKKCCYLVLTSIVLFVVFTERLLAGDNVMHFHN